MGMVSGQPWPGCQLALQAEQNSVSQALHCTSCGVCSPISWSWHTAWQVDAGHQVRQGSRSTSGTGNKNGQVKLRRTKDLGGLRTDGHGLHVFITSGNKGGGLLRSPQPSALLAGMVRGPLLGKRPTCTVLPTYTPMQRSLDPTKKRTYGSQSCPEP